MNIFDLLIVQPVFNLLMGLYAIVPGGDFGISIILFTIIVRFALYPLLKRQLHQTKMMHKLQPELKKIKARNKGNRQAEGAAMMELYKKHDVSPFRSIGILLIQLPIFIALYRVIQIFTQQRNDIDKFTYDFMRQLEPVEAIIRHPEQFHERLFGFIDLTTSAFTHGKINIFVIVIALIAAVTQYFMTRQIMPKTDSKKGLRQIMAEAAEGKAADQSEINAVMMGKMSKFMPIFMFLIMISVPGALGLYYATSNLVAVAQQSYILKQDEDELEAIASEPDKKPKKPGKKATAKAREKAAREANITRISAK